MAGRLEAAASNVNQFPPGNEVSGILSWYGCATYLDRCELKNEAVSQALFFVSG
jgi:hypothetical protein